MSMKLNVREMINGGPSRLRFVFRYSTSRVFHRESVAEHSYYVALYGLLVARWVEENKTLLVLSTGARLSLTSDDESAVCLGNLLQRALLHDLEEARSGDFPRPFKHSNPELKEMLERASQHAFEQVMLPLIEQPEEDMYEGDAHGPVASEYICSWLDAKDGTPEGRILQFADFLAVLGFMLQEGLGAGNQSIKEHVRDMGKYFAGFTGAEYDFIRPLVEQAGEIMKELFPDGLTLRT